MIRIDGQSLSCEALHAVANGAELQLDEGAARRMAANAAQTPAGPGVLEAKRTWLIGEHARHMAGEELTRAFIIGHCAGVGEPFPSGVVRAAMAARANVLAGGHTGSRPQAAQVLVDMVNDGVIPTVPSQGSVGAAGDLAPLAHIAKEALGYKGYEPTGKEALSLINGATVTAALAGLAVVRTERVLTALVDAAAMTFEAWRGDVRSLDPRPLQARGHAGAVSVAERLRGLLEGSTQATVERLPDAFSLRCAPAVLGAARDALDHVRGIVERELNGACDNPLLFDGAWLEGGNFHGAPVAVAMDYLKIALTQAATQSERRTFHLTYQELSNGLPSFLVAGTGLNSGFMIAQYTAASLASECKGLCMPASVDSIPTVQHYEDHVSMGPIAARHALRVLECVADIAAIEQLLAAQALDMRVRGLAWDHGGEPILADPVELAPGVEALRRRVRDVVAFWEDDNVMHPALEAVGRLVRGGDW